MTVSPASRRSDREERGILGHVVTEASEQTELLLQLVFLPERQTVKILDGHPKNAEELLLREVSLQAGEV